MAEWFVHVTTRSSFRSVTPRGSYFPGSLGVGGLMRRSDLGVGDPNEESRSGACSTRSRSAYAHPPCTGITCWGLMTKVSEDMMWSSGVSFRMHHLLALRRRFAMNCSRRTNAPTMSQCVLFPASVSHSFPLQRANMWTAWSDYQL